MATYRCPDGSETENNIKYLKQWNDLINVIQEIPGVQVVASNPSVTIRHENFTIQLPTRFAKEIVRIIQERDELKLRYVTPIIRFKREEK
jgi:hypothetical protein